MDAPALGGRRLSVGRLIASPSPALPVLHIADVFFLAAYPSVAHISAFYLTRNKVFPGSKFFDVIVGLNLSLFYDDLSSFCYRT